ncbi:alpha/beta hydrolase [Aestuariimicrobium sp. T2.26MG-19.2B]|uniref:alpha/beta hydrolase n=1 Tax=Aestuariimicrobium sp. T2.26MG-19.2B TaxID=3040679 RepID=UPI002477B954|nr:dienelactone hydrolase family protein [Aestuariimicrobium sp. T2.26MG-19.2B]CAI9409647.1 Carboxylesterase 2 [Aestuariimicrobium sp. T2.26MG-19.2B]
MANTHRIDDSAVQWRDAEGGRQGSHLLLMLHGVGSNEHDLIGLAPYLPTQLTVASLPGPLPWPNGGRSWFDVTPDHSTDTSKISASVAGILDWLDARPEHFESVGVLGFSQGAATALQLVRTDIDRFAYVVALSGFVYNGGGENDAALAARRLPGFVAFGTADQVITAEKTRATLDWAPDHLDLELHDYPMGHTIIEPELEDVVAFLQRQLARTRA